MKRLAIIDGSGFMFRAWYAFPPLMNKEGKNLNVVYGFTRMMLKLLAEQYEYFVIARDSAVKTKRHEAYQEYKATRKKLEDAFKIQIPLVHQVINELWVANIAAPGYEADDIIATLVKNYQNLPDLSIQVFSSDKDLKQLLQSNVLVTDPLKNLTTTVADFEQEFGFAPASIVDYLALIGDSADNIKGVAGIGPKKALDLIQRFGTIENIYEHLEDIWGELKEKLAAGVEDALFSKQLIELMQVPELENKALEEINLTVDLEKWKEILIGEWEFFGLKKFFEEWKKKLKTPQQLGLF